MMALFLSEWERLWKRKLTWLCFLAIPVILLATAKYYAGLNAQVAPSSPEYTYASNFAVMALIEQLLVVFNLVSLVLLTLSFTEEYRSGQLRLVLLRAYSFGELFRAKALAYLAVMGLYFACYLILAAAVGPVFFETGEAVSLFYRDAPMASAGGMVLYTLGYYGLAALSVLTTGSVFLAIAVLSRSTTASIGAGLGYLLLSLGYPTVFDLLRRTGVLQADGVWQFLSLTQIQYQGIAMLLGETAAFSSGQLALVLLPIAGAYLLAGGLTAWLAFTKPDRWI
ncbi:hypothetical protein J31TS4_37970 [Paenibacillus sp. J31TS4]|uniref:hypothetical protein n=1 Tax=Paenibacillus sp. J31TS4 TaxID=2807195 RepID=UPI001B076DEF|nr:hypothetical protein [Paenibacillus sp. J31TS4]GIP40517.1 hypothetical protein J31TS4_37970 [Paenibacillus sp. J31TS4]